MEVRIESPFPFEALPRIWRWMESFRGKVADDFAPRTEDEFICHFVRRWKLERTWAVYAGGELGGLITFAKLTAWLGTAHVLLKPDFQGKGVAVRVCRAAVAEMFDQEGVGKLEFRVLAGNLAIGSLLITIGARREGTLIAQTLRDGKPTDVWAYGLMKAAFEEKSNVVSIRSNNSDQHEPEPATAVG